MKYEEIPSCSKAQAESALARNSPSELSRVVIGVGLYAEDFVWAETFCMRLVGHPDEYVRGDAILSFGHLARRGAALNEETVKPVIQNALKDGSAFVRGHAHDAIDDIEFSRVAVRLTFMSSGRGETTAASGNHSGPRRSQKRYVSHPKGEMK